MEMLDEGMTEPDRVIGVVVRSSKHGAENGVQWVVHDTFSAVLMRMLPPKEVTLCGDRPGCG
jgi:hypothetical protein